MSEFLSDDSIKQYVSGCEQIAVALDDAIQGVQEAGKKPTILIPSRGALPITLIATSLLGELDPNHILLDSHRTRYYPDKIFEYLSNGRIPQNGSDESEVDVVLYPFTADVTSEGKEEVLAKQLRGSASAAFLDLIEGAREGLDFNWYKLLMGKMQGNAFQTDGLSTQTVVKSLESLIPSAGRQVILVDTVVSGRASSQIISAFNNLGHGVLPILAVDETEGSNRLQVTLKGRISQNMSWWEYMSGKVTSTPFTHFPLITEDKGAALLGVAAVNFTNFNEPGFFSRVDCNFPAKFLPQSCVWALPPMGKSRESYIEAFHQFLDHCVDPEKVVNSWRETSDVIASLVKYYGDIDSKEVAELANVDQFARGKESSSHITSITLSDKQAASWAREFCAVTSGRLAA